MSIAETRMSGPAADGPATTRRLVGRRTLMAGMAAIGAVGVLGGGRALAQDDSDDVPFVDEELAPEIGEAYQNFVAKLAANLGESDVSTVDTAIRDALAAMVEEQFAAGTISRNLADELIERIQTGDAPLAVAMLAGMRGPRMERRKKRRDDEDDASDDSGAPSSDATPTI